jgi:DNA-binding response OmpR family regulator
MVKRILVVAEQVPLRARIAQALQAGGYAVELAADEARAHKLAGGKGIEAAIVAQGPSVAAVTIARDLIESVPRLVVLVNGRNELLRLNRSLPKARAFLLESFDEHELLNELTHATSSAENTQGESSHTSMSLDFEDRRVDLVERTLLDVDGRKIKLTHTE